MQINLTDHEQRFADSPAGKLAVAYAWRKHETQQAHRGAQAQPWNDRMEASVIRNLALSDARAGVERSAFMADAARQMPVLRAAAETARLMRDERLRTAYMNR